jgi:hypothetical protein
MQENVDDRIIKIESVKSIDNDSDIVMENGNQETHEDFLEDSGDKYRD